METWKMDKHLTLQVLIDAFIHFFIFCRLCTVELTRFRVKREFDGQRQCVGVIACVGDGMRCGFGINHPQLFEAFAGQARRSDRQIKDFCDRRGNRTFVSRNIPEDHVVRHDPSLPISRVSEKVQTH